MSDLLIGIPTRSNASGLRRLLGFLDDEGLLGATVVYDHGHTTDEGRAALADALRDGAEVVDAKGWPFYGMWNEARREAYARGRDVVALLNDDICLGAGGLRLVCDVLLAHPEVGLVGFDYTRSPSETTDPEAGLRVVSGTPRRGGIGGWAFALRADLWPTIGPVSEAYHIWYGDDELFCMVEDAGLSLAICEGAGVEHETSTTLNEFPELRLQTDSDLQLFVSRWGSHRL